LVRTNGELKPVSWAIALATVAKKFSELRARNGKFGIIGSNHTTNEENYLLQKFAREVLGTSNIDHHRTGDVATLMDALHGRTGALAATSDLYNVKAALVVGSDLAQEQPYLAWQLRANWRHHNAHIYAITPGPVREDNYGTAARSEPGREFEALEALRDRLAAEPELAILFGDAIKGDSVRRLVAFGDSLGIPVKYVCLVDYSNSRGASDMGVLPDLLPGYHSVRDADLHPGLNYDEILATPDLDALWVVGANPLARQELAAMRPFIIVQDLFPTETAKLADVVLPASSAYEKNGTVTNVCGDVQKLRRASKTMGTKPDLEIITLLAREMGADLGDGKPEAVFQEIRNSVRGYSVPPAVIETGGAAQTAPVDGHVEFETRPELIRSAHNTLFTSGTLGRFSAILNSLLEAPGELYNDPHHQPQVLAGSVQVELVSRGE
jgi:NADH-quinone oxidoreductase subunit G